MKRKIRAILLTYGWSMALVVVPTLAQRADAASAALERLIGAARKEGNLDVAISSRMREVGSREMIDTFKRRFGLDIKISADISGQESQKFTKAIAETKGKIPPTLDLIEGVAGNVLLLKEAEGAARIDNWEQLLAEIAPEAYKVKDKVSPSVLSGYGFLRATLTFALLYNPKLISERDLPRTWKEIGDLKYAGAFSVPPWIAEALLGLLKYDKDELLGIVKSWGKNKRDVLTYEAGIQRMMLGDFKFLYSSDFNYYYDHKVRDPNAPIAFSFFEDLTSAAEVMYVVREGARNLNAAKLWALWATSPEAHLLLEKYAYQSNLALGTGPISKEAAKTLKDRNIKPIGWFDNSQTLQKFLWLKTEEGQKYQQAFARAHRSGE